MGNNSPPEGIDWTCGAAALRLEGGRISGTGGINGLMGDYRLVGEIVTFGPVATTMMAGPPDRMAAEQRFLGDLARVARWAIVDDELVLGDETGLELIRLRCRSTN